MSWATAVVLIVLITAIAGVMRHRGAPDRASRHAPGPSEREQELEREVSDLRDRVHVLERIATDANSNDAIETRRIAEEIESLRQGEPQDNNQS